MTDFYSPKSGAIKVDGQTYILRKGIHPVADAVANSHEANVFGIKPVSEMTPEEYRLLGLVAPEPLPDVIEQAADPAPEPETPKAKSKDKTDA